MMIMTLFFIIIVQLLFVFLFITSYVAFQDDFMVVAGIPFYLIIVVILNFLSLYVLKNVYQRLEKQKIKQTESTHIEEFHSLVTSVRSDRHDLNNHLTVVAGLMDIENFQAAHKYLKQMIGDIRITNKALAIKNPVLLQCYIPKWTNIKKIRLDLIHKLRVKKLFIYYLRPI